MRVQRAAGAVGWRGHGSSLRSSKEALGAAADAQSRWPDDGPDHANGASSDVGSSWRLRPASPRCSNSLSVLHPYRRRPSDCSRLAVRVAADVVFLAPLAELWVL